MVIFGLHDKCEPSANYIRDESWQNTKEDFCVLPLGMFRICRKVDSEKWRFLYLGSSAIADVPLFLDGL